MKKTDADNIDNSELFIVLTNKIFSDEICFRVLPVIEMNRKVYVEYGGANKDECRDEHGNIDMSNLSEKLRHFLPDGFSVDDFIKERYIVKENHEWFLIETDVCSLIGESKKFMCEFGECTRKVLKF